jgi:hypothetical protein
MAQPSFNERYDTYSIVDSQDESIEFGYISLPKGDEPVAFIELISQNELKLVLKLPKKQYTLAEKLASKK